MTSEELAKKIITTIPYITIATVCEDGTPWNSPVFAVHDDSYNFYWCSWKENQHSKNIRSNGSVFVVIYDSRMSEDDVDGVYFKGHATELTSPEEIEQVPKDLYVGLNSFEGKSPSEYMLGSYPRRTYKVTPEQMWMNKDSTLEGDHIDTRVEITLL